MDLAHTSSAQRNAGSHNRLLAQLPPEQTRRLASSMEEFVLEPGQVLQESGAPVTQMIFPLSGTISLNLGFADGHASAAALLGRDGVLGLELCLGESEPAEFALVLAAGRALRLPAHCVREELRKGGELRPLALRAAQALLTQTAQTAACNRHHNLDQQLARWLLRCFECQSSESLAMTQETIAQMLGVRREGVTAAAGRLQEAGILEYSRGRIRLLDRRGLERRACECHALVRAEMARLLHDRPRDSMAGAA